MAKSLEIQELNLQIADFMMDYSFAVESYPYFPYYVFYFHRCIT